MAGGNFGNLRRQPVSDPVSDKLLWVTQKERKDFPLKKVVVASTFVQKTCTIDLLSSFENFCHAETKCPVHHPRTRAKTAHNTCDPVEILQSLWFAKSNLQ